MKNVILLIVTIIALQINAQQKHFSLSMALRIQSDSIFCDLIANEDYSIGSLQMGFNHNSDNVEFLTTQAVTLPDLNQLGFKEVCPKYVRMLWSDSKFHNSKKGEVLFSLIYKELHPTDHYICMMPSSGAPGGNCTNFLREVTDEKFNFYIVDDVCINYKIESGQPLLLSADNQTTDHLNVCLNGQCNGLIIDSDPEFSMRNAKLEIVNISGASCLTQSLQSTTHQSVDVSKIPAGIYFYRIVNERASLKSGKIVLK